LSSRAPSGSCRRRGPCWPSSSPPSPVLCSRRCPSARGPSAGSP
jgi:hypothetical protein